MSLGISACRETTSRNEIVSKGMFSVTLIRLKAFKRIFVFRSFVCRVFLVRNDQILKSAFSLVYVPWDLGVSKNCQGNHI